jgi:hypothetical protein
MKDRFRQPSDEKPPVRHIHIFDEQERERKQDMLQRAMDCIKAAEIGADASEVLETALQTLLTEAEKSRKISPEYVADICRTALAKADEICSTFEPTTDTDSEPATESNKPSVAELEVILAELEAMQRAQFNEEKRAEIMRIGDTAFNRAFAKAQKRQQRANLRQRVTAAMKSFFDALSWTLDNSPALIVIALYAAGVILFILQLLGLWHASPDLDY